MALTPGTKLGPYEILSPLGSGGMGEVWRARDSRLGREVAVKVLPESLARDPDARLRFAREARAVAALSHPNVLGIFDVGESAETAFAVTELLEGKTLRAHLDAGALAPPRAAEWAAQILQGLAAAHEKGIVHRDLKPENVFVTRDGRVKLLDFGLARQMDVAADASISPTRSLHTDPGTVLGTAPYMSPEQARGEVADHRSDVFSFGAVLFEMLAGRRAFTGTSAAEVLAAVLRDPVVPPVPGDALADALFTVANHCLEKEPHLRFQSARDVAFALQAAETSSARAITTPPPVRADAPSLAVLPFYNMSPEKDAEYFSDGVSEEIISALMKLPGLRVAARTSSFAFKGKSEDVRGIGEKLGVKTVLEGSVRQAGGKLRITAQLIDVASGWQLWSERFDRSLEDVFAVQDEIARAIAETLEVKLLHHASAPLVPNATEDPEAYDLFLRGRYFFNRRAAPKAIEAFEAALARDPAYAAAWTGLADAYGIHGYYGGIDTRVALARGRAAAEKARSLAPESAEVNVSTAILEHYFGWDFVREERELREAMLRSPRAGAPHYWLGVLFGLRRRLSESLPEIRKGIELEPLNPYMPAAEGWAFFSSSRFAEAREAFARGLEVDPGATLPLYGHARSSLALGEVDAAVATFERLVGVAGRTSTFALGSLAEGLAGAGRKDEARRILGELRARHAGGDYVPATHVVNAEGALGDHEAAFASMTRAFEERNALAWWWIAYDPLLEAVRSHPGYPALHARLGAAG